MWWRRAQKHEHDEGDTREGRLPHIGRGKQIGHPHILGHPHQFRTDESCRDPASERERDGTWTIGRRCGVRRGEAILRDEGLVGAAAEGRETEEREARVKDRCRAQHTGEHAEQRSAGKAAAATEASHGKGGGERRSGRAEHEGEHGDGRELHLACQRAPDEPARRDHDAGIGAGERGRRRQHPSVEPCEAVPCPRHRSHVVSIPASLSDGMEACVDEKRATAVPAPVLNAEGTRCQKPHSVNDRRSWLPSGVRKRSGISSDEPWTEDRLIRYARARSPRRTRCRRTSSRRTGCTTG